MARRITKPISKPKQSNRGKTLDDLKELEENNKQEELAIPDRIALSIYVGIYKKMLDSLKPYHGLFEINTITQADVLVNILSYDNVIDITSIIPQGTTRGVIRAYISAAAKSDKDRLTALLIDLIRHNSIVPNYFLGNRANIIRSIVSKLCTKTWGICTIESNPTLSIIDKNSTEGMLSINTGIRIYARIRS